MYTLASVPPAICEETFLHYNELVKNRSLMAPMGSDLGEVSLLLQELRAGLPDAEARLLSIVYSELRKIADYHLRRDRSGHTLQPTALVNEAYLRLTRANLANITDREHFFAVASRVMRRILVDYARSRYAQKRGGHQVREDVAEIPLHKTASVEEFLALDQALSRLATWDERQSRIVELRFFGGLTEEEIAWARHAIPRFTRSLAAFVSVLSKNHMSVSRV
jgi:RNA polymerase sigma-70 factor (ECF subfamily)